jgi:hypothetical protein
MLKWISVNTRKYEIQNEKIHLKIGVTHINEKMMESRLRWFSHVEGERLIRQ